MPFKSRLYRAYLGVLHSLYNSLRLLALCLRHRTRCGPYATAIARGHLRALNTIMR
jgi:hypothetical protein